MCSLPTVSNAILPLLWDPNTDLNMDESQNMSFPNVDGSEILLKDTSSILDEIPNSMAMPGNDATEYPSKLPTVATSQFASAGQSTAQIGENRIVASDGNVSHRQPLAQNHQKGASGANAQDVNLDFSTAQEKSDEVTKKSGAKSKGKKSKGKGRNTMGGGGREGNSKSSREVLNQKYPELEKALPPNAQAALRENGKVNKPRILEAAISSYAEMKKKLLTLDAEIMLSSDEKLQGAIEKRIRESKSFITILTELIGLICAKEDWKYAEVWRVGNPSFVADTHIAPYIHSEELSKIEGFKEASSKCVTSAAGLIDRLNKTCEAEWFSAPDCKETSFHRATECSRFGISSCFAVPVCLKRQDCAIAIVMVFDSSLKTYDAELVDTVSMVCNKVANQCVKPGASSSAL
eukprot:Plantae.Rhodophyta-Hildenbrandia_rubra.ctg18043.p1 GENE.Plantae.Rhodophyta-Hildenbrandia_rubra.ctg18043~~Plantae.Rhodophyta-Hildenbrandia_rubra.ctg18043.p1  ORF type:complete len:406 (-),score=71.23 Plantae.Rhodophyta-Hildenbrandia_rubra.ctg18043:2614-3831(-)